MEGVRDADKTSNALDAAAGSAEGGRDVKRDDELMFYVECWRELQNFLAEVVIDNTGEYPQASEFLKLMRSVERKVERNDG